MDFYYRSRYVSEKLPFSRNLVLTFSFDKKSDNESVIVAFTILISYGVSVSNYNRDYKGGDIMTLSQVFRVTNGEF